MSWTDKEIETLKVLLARRVAAAEIALELNKTVDEIRRRTETLGFGIIPTPIGPAKSMEAVMSGLDAAKSMENATMAFDEFAAFNQSTGYAFLQSASTASKGFEATLGHQPQVKASPLAERFGVAFTQVARDAAVRAAINGVSPAGLNKTEQHPALVGTLKAPFWPVEVSNVVVLDDDLSITLKERDPG